VLSAITEADFFCIIQRINVKKNIYIKRRGKQPPTQPSSSNKKNSACLEFIFFCLIKKLFREQMSEVLEKILLLSAGRVGNTEFIHI